MVHVAKMMLLGHGFLEDSSWLANLIAFYDDVIDLVGERRRVDIIYLSFIKAFDAVLVTSSMNSWLNTGQISGQQGRLKTEWIGPNGCGTKSTWRQVISAH